jgi:Flp pilus assembly pilin Flp
MDCPSEEHPGLGLKAQMAGLARPQMEKLGMHDPFLRLRIKFWELIYGEDGQDLIEYGMIVALIALAAIGGIEHFASAVVTMFSNIDASLS